MSVAILIIFLIRVVYWSYGKSSEEIPYSENDVLFQNPFLEPVSLSNDDNWLNNTSSSEAKDIETDNERGLLSPFTQAFEHCIVPPQECPNENVTFYLFTRETQDNPEIIDMLSSEPIRKSKFVENQPLKILIHGYTTNYMESPNLEIRPAYFQTYDYNIISVDHSPLVRDPCYFQAVQNVPLISNCTAQMIDYLVYNQIVDIKDIHIIGFSLGAQITGQIANYITSGKLPRVTGLDPAMPLFITMYNESKLDETDAEFVDVIHTDSGMRGKMEAMGTVDFYVNGGYRQPGCESEADQSSCSHYRAPAIYAESINTEVGFWANPCNGVMACVMGQVSSNDPSDKILVGEYVNRSVSGTYYLTTNSESPYAVKDTENTL